jgi:hypothetical protein
VRKETGFGEERGQGGRLERKNYLVKSGNGDSASQKGIVRVLRREVCRCFCSEEV